VNAALECRPIGIEKRPDDLVGRQLWPREPSRNLAEIVTRLHLDLIGPWLRHRWPVNRNSG
jgi:hypothetical protein